MKIVVALGGNMISDASVKGEPFNEQLRKVEETAEIMVEFKKLRHQLIITHGNGPQVGSLLLQQQESSQQTTKLPLNVLGAMTQGLIGIMLQHSLMNKFEEHGIKRQSDGNTLPVAIVPTTVVVERNDPGFKNPEKPIGPFYSEEEFKSMIKDPDHIYKKLEKGYRRVVPSPYPKRILEKDIIDMIADKYVVIAVGGGGSPSVEEDGKISLVDAVIDKDRASAILAKQINAELLMVLTNVPGVYKNFGTDQEKLVSKMTAEEAQNMLDADELGTGSMGPKVEAAIAFSKVGDTIITSPENAVKSLRGEAGTRILKRIK